jgi:DNA-binding NarL/FixJ family response regulator
LAQVPKRSCSILLIDDHSIVRRGLRLIVEREFPNCLIGEAANAAQARLELRRRPWDVVVLDLNLPDAAGFDLLREIKDSGDSNILVFSMYPEKPLAARALRAGALGYVSKQDSEEELCAALRAVAEGRRYVGPGAVESLADLVAGRGEAAAHEALSDREFEVLMALVNGKSVTEIAATLEVSVQTISTFRRRILRKLGVRSNAELTRYALENKLLI